MIASTAMLCLALNIYHEARGESLTGQHAVAQVTMNRAQRDPKKVCSVVFNKHQFSWTTGHTKRSKGKVSVSLVPKEDKAWRMAKAVARVTIEGWTPDFTKGSTHYHSNVVRPQWAKAQGMKPTLVVGLHHFYRYA